MVLLRTRWARLRARFGCWPRRIAALCCLLFAAAGAVTEPPAARRVRSGIADRLRPGEVAIPLTVSAGSAAIVQPGDRVGVVAAPDDSSAATLLADRLRVLSIRLDDASVGDAAATVVVVGSRSQAVAAARTTSGRLVLIVDDLP